MKTVRILHPWLPNYRVAFFLELIELGKQDKVDYQIYAGEVPNDSFGRNDQHRGNLGFNILETKEFSIGNRSVLIQKVDKQWLNADLVIAENAIRNWTLYKWLFLDKPKLIALWGHGRTYTKQKTKIEEALKRFLLMKSDWFFGYTEKGVQHGASFGFPKNRTTVVQNSTDTELLKFKVEEITEDKISQFRLKHSITSENVAVFIGALDESKRLDFLIESSRQIQEKLSDFQLLIFGEGPVSISISKMSDPRDYVKLCGRADEETLAHLSKVAKIILMPGRVGLVAVDSFALGLPIVTTEWEFHAPEFEYLENQFNAVITEDDPDAYAEEVVSLLTDMNRLLTLRNNCLESSKGYSIQLMASNFHRGVMRLLDQNG
jgi:glycosyltransferase involved in cell wall biosynthesis